MKVFLSHKMNGLTVHEVMEIRAKALCYLKAHYDNIELIDNYHHNDAPENAGRIWHLGTSIRMMDDADAIFFCEGWQMANGCQIEYAICERYGLRILNNEI